MNSSPLISPKDLIPALGGSGFPFQAAVAAKIRATDLFTVEEEVAWRDDDGSHRFLDMVAMNDRVRICIECKKMKNDKLVFLVPSNPSKRQSGLVRAVWLNRTADSLPRSVVMYGVAETDPPTPESMYCVVCSKEDRLIEKEAQPLVRGTEEYAKDRCHRFNPLPLRSPMCIPVLITAASLFVAEYDPSDVSLIDGVYRARKEHLKPVPFVRFTKEFTSHGLDTTRLRTVFVGQAKHLNELVPVLNSASTRDYYPETAKIFDPLDGR